MPSVVPHFFEYRQASGEGSRLYPFHYTHETKVFSVAEKELQLTDFGPYGFNPYLLEMDPEGIPVDEMPQHAALLPGFGAILAGPRLHDWANDNPREVVNTYKVMHAAYASFLQDDSFMPPLARSSSHLGFNAGVREYGGISLQVIGDCACMGPNPYGLYTHGQFEAGWAEYDLHNADTQAQRASLYAGIGHLARLAAKAR